MELKTLVGFRNTARHGRTEPRSNGIFDQDRPMQDSFRNSRQSRGQRRPRSGLNSSKAFRDGNGNVPANARRQYERYVALAQAAVLSGDAVEAQNYYQHAEHFFRVMRGQEIEANEVPDKSEPR